MIITECIPTERQKLKCIVARRKWHAIDRLKDEKAKILHRSHSIQFLFCLFRLLQLQKLLMLAKEKQLSFIFSHLCSDTWLSCFQFFH